MEQHLAEEKGRVVYAIAEWIVEILKRLGFYVDGHATAKLHRTCSIPIVSDLLEEDGVTHTRHPRAESIPIIKAYKQLQRAQ